MEYKNDTNELIYKTDSQTYGYQGGLVGRRPDWGFGINIDCIAVHTLEEEMAKPTPVFSPGESQGRGSLVGCRLWGRAESDTTDAA